MGTPGAPEPTHLFWRAPMNRLYRRDKLKRFVSFKLAGRIILTVAFGDLTSFDSYPHGAIVNAANEECKTGGGVSKSLHDEGGPTYDELVRSLPVTPKSGKNVRIFTGDAKIVGPKQMHHLKVDRIIHACGPNYKTITKGQKQKLDLFHSLLSSAYKSALDLVDENNLHQVCFPLLSGGQFIGNQSRKTIIDIGLKGMYEWATKMTSKKGTNYSLTDIVWVAHDTEVAWDMITSCDKLLRGTVKAAVV